MKKNLRVTSVTGEKQRSMTVVIPKKITKSMNLNAGTQLAFYQLFGFIIIKK